MPILWQRSSTGPPHDFTLLVWTNLLHHFVLVRFVRKCPFSCVSDVRIENQIETWRWCHASSVTDGPFYFPKFNLLASSLFAIFFLIFFPFNAHVSLHQVISDLACEQCCSQKCFASVSCYDRIVSRFCSTVCITFSASLLGATPGNLLLSYPNFRSGFNWDGLVSWWWQCR